MRELFAEPIITDFPRSSRMNWKITGSNGELSLIPIGMMNSCLSRGMSREICLRRKRRRGSLLKERAKAPGGQGGNKQQKTSNKKGKGGGTPGGNNNPTAGLTAGQGMKFCPLCHGAGLPETVYHTHNMATCNKKDVFSQALSAAVNLNLHLVPEEDVVSSISWNIIVLR
jgi:hypothetical protein